MKRIKAFLLGLQFLLKPRYWSMNNPYNKQWDEIFNELLEKYDFEVNHTLCYAKLGSVYVWIANAPYACFTPYMPSCDVRPSRITIQKGLKKLNLSERKKKEIKNKRLKEHLNSLQCKIN